MGSTSGDQAPVGASETRAPSEVFPTVESDTYRACLVRAAELVGGTVPLSHRLQVPIADLARWLAEGGKPSFGAFIRVVDMLLEKRPSGAVQSLGDPSQASKP